MAKRAKKSGSSYSYLKDQLGAHPEWVEQRSNAPILEQYRKDHGLADDAVVDRSVMNNLSTLKSKIRSEARKTKRKTAKAAGVKLPKPTDKLEFLEARIDDCLTIARSMNSSKFDAVIEHLRAARNKVVMIGG